MTAATCTVPAGTRTQHSRLLIVTHGEGRGRPRQVMLDMLERCQSTRPQIAARLDVHRTGDPLPDLSRYGGVFFFLADPLAALFPHCYAEAREIAAAAAALGLRILTPPDALNLTQKSRQSEIWQAAGFRCARSHTFASAAELRALIDTLPFPQILRNDLGHAQHSAVVCQTRQDAIRALRHMTYPGVALDFIDTRHGPGHGPYSRYYHKKRCFVFGPEVVNNHVFFATSPIVGQASSTFLQALGWRSRLLRMVGIGARDLRETLAADTSYFLSPPEAPDIMRAATGALGLSMAAIDYSVTADGEIALWEANPYFSLPNMARQILLSRERLWRQRLERFHDSFGDWMAGLLAEMDGAAKGEAA